MKTVVQICIFSFLKTFTEIVFVITLTLPLSLFAQFHDDFSDNEFSHAPSWQGSISDFIVADSVLQLKAGPGISSAWLSTVYEGGSNLQWDFSVKLLFNPSASNYARAYLFSDSPDLSGSLDGYFVMLGNTADEVALYRQSGATKTKIIDGVDGRLNAAEIELDVRVTMDQNGQWKLWTKVPAETDYSLEGSASEAPLSIGTGSFGFQCVFTSTRSDKFFFDDITIAAAPIVDHIPPGIDSVIVINSTQLSIHFSEPVVFNDTPEGHFAVTDGIGGCSTALIPPDGREMTLTFSHTFEQGRNYLLVAIEISDPVGNVSKTLQAGFIYTEIIPPFWKCVVINEIFADPSPTQGLPEKEFIEIFNTTAASFSLKGWTLTDGSTTAKLPDVVIRPQDFIILTSTGAQAEFEPFGKCASTTSFPSLNNSGDLLVLKDSGGTRIDSLNYSSSWYKDSEKAEGGWSLELIDPENVCAEGSNWIASNTERGGTPGYQNSVADHKPDVIGPELVSAFLTAEDTLVLTFNEKLEKVVPISKRFELSPPVEVKQVLLDESLSVIRVIPQNPFEGRKLYQLKLTGIYDCAGNEVNACCNSAMIVLPESADSLDVVINEILFNPNVGGTDFVELYNRSSKFINLQNWTLTNIDKAEAPLKITDSPLLLPPGAIIAICNEPETILNQYPNAVKENGVFFQSVIPAYDDDAGHPVISDERGVKIDGFVYDESMHSVFLQDVEGVSLERVAVTGAQNVLRSASSRTGFATPGYKNGNLQIDTLSDQIIDVNPKAFLPINGQPNYCTISYNLDSPGYMMSIAIYDSQGTKVKALIENELVGQDGHVTWEGDTAAGQVAFGSFMIVVSLFNSEGMAKRYRIPVVVAPDFR